MAMNEFNWYTELENAIKEEPTEEKHLELLRLSDKWVTCACGQLCKNLPRNGNGQPRDEELFNYGIMFSYSISERYWFSALAILNLIEKRTIYLLTL